MSEEMIKALEAYDELFDDSFPTIPLLSGNTEEGAMQIIKCCLEAKKDVYEMGLLTLDPDVMY